MCYTAAMSQAPRLTVIIPGFRTPEAWWRRAIVSVIAALAPTDELLCIDDGDPGSAFLEDLCRQDTRTRVIHQPNAGQAVARNRGIAAARGRYIAFADSDDRVLPDAYQDALDALNRARADVALFGVRSLWTAEGILRDDIPPAVNGEALTPRQVLTLCDTGLFYYPWNKIYRTDFLRGHGLAFHPHGMPCEDVALNLACLTAGAKWCLIPVIGYLYRRHGGSSLLRYSKTLAVGLRVGQEAWRAYAATDPEAERRFADRYRRPDTWYTWENWKNLWRPGSPLTKRERWQWLAECRPSLLTGPGGWRKALLRLSPRCVVWAEIVVQTLCRALYRPWLRRMRLLATCPTARRMTREERETLEG